PHFLFIMEGDRPSYLGLIDNGLDSYARPDATVTRRHRGLLKYDTLRHPDHPHFQDFGDMMLRGNNGFGYVRLDWFTPYGLGTWGDGRLFILGTEGYIEARKYTNVGVSKQGNNLFIVDQKQARYIDCNNLTLPFGPQFVSDIV